jgi:uncharacterized protein DUF5675
MASNSDFLESLKTAKVQREKKLEPNATADKKICKARVDVVITVNRKQYVDDATLGTFDARRVGDAAAAVTGGTLEQKHGTFDLGLGNGTKSYPVSAGTYNGLMRGEPGNTKTSKNHGVAAPYSLHAVEVLNVPHFGDVLLHIGTVPHDTEGCILLGGDTVVTDVPIKQGKKVVRTEQHGRIKAGTTRQKVWDLLDFIYTVKDENDGEMPRITVIIKDP